MYKFPVSHEAQITLPPLLRLSTQPPSSHWYLLRTYYVPGATQGLLLDLTDFMLSCILTVTEDKVWESIGYEHPLARAVRLGLQEEVESKLRPS